MSQFACYFVTDWGTACGEDEFRCGDARVTFYVECKLRLVLGHVGDASFGVDFDSEGFGGV